ncbi:MAG: LysM peptidoglycan-binding domain-containing protein [Bacillus sp. (in: Bacteria)]|nr:LysM peptidoglycan-binding domain-containing protein [Bacillus sp. (in: firmicutes)]MCM1425195.1 LysM peptidoglycan-binding domain-containing protein [Eubacterium sp.]
MGMGLRLKKKTGVMLLGAAILVSAMPCVGALAAGQYAFIYEADGQEQDGAYMTLTEVLEDYTVLDGDSLWKIAKEQLGDGNAYVELAAANRDIIENPDLIYPGMNLKITKTGYIRYAHKDGMDSGGIQMGKYAMDMPYGWTTGIAQSGEAFANFVMSGEGAVACLVQDKKKELSAGIPDWSDYREKITAYVERNYPTQVSELQFAQYRMDGQGDASGELYLYSYLWHISPEEYPTLTCRVCVGMKLTDHIQAEFVGYTLDDYDIQSCVRYVTASFEERFDNKDTGKFTVNDSNMTIAPDAEWPPAGMYNSFAYIDEFFTSLLQEAAQMEADTKEESRYSKIF